MQCLDDVSALAHASERRLKVLSEAPSAGCDFLGQAEALQLLKTAGAERLPEMVLFAAGSDDVVRVGLPKESPVEAGEALLFDLGAEVGLDFVIGAGPEVEGDDLCGTFPHAPAQILTGYDEVFASIILAPQDDMRVRMTGVVVIHGDPIEFCSEILPHLEHEPTGQTLQVWVFCSVLSGDDEAELVTIAVTPFEEGPAISAILLGAVEIARLSLSRDPIALQVPQMRLCAALA
jgi:hypothetical protein